MARKRNSSNQRGSNVATIRRILREEGFSDLAINASLARMRQESNFNPLAINRNDGGPGHHSRGIFQWNRGRLTALERFAKQQGTSRDDLATQARFYAKEVKGEIRGSNESRYGRRLLAAKTPEAAAEAAISLARPAGWTSRNPRGGHGWNNTLNWTRNLGVAPAQESTLYARNPEAQPQGFWGENQAAQSLGDSPFQALFAGGWDELLQNASAPGGLEQTLMQFMSHPGGAGASAAERSAADSPDAIQTILYNLQNAFPEAPENPEQGPSAAEFVQESPDIATAGEGIDDQLTNQLTSSVWDFLGKGDNNDSSDFAGPWGSGGNADRFAETYIQPEFDVSSAAAGGGGFAPILLGLASLFGSVGGSGSNQQRPQRLSSAFSGEMRRDARPSPGIGAIKAQIGV